MAIHWNISKVSRWKQKMNNRNNEIFFSALVHSFLVIGVGHVTESGIDELYERLQRYENVFGPLLVTNKQKPIRITKRELRKWIGLSTNIAPLSNAEFDRHIRKLACRRKKESSQV
ncbi:MAG: hypothetical protein BWY31_03442 [Lentisphaerae bacterium ADurb.Bin242]|nr:MAG: hypothetical protein BWY31_03442 [Lentisphaerae bacterium ADurb.Bin242]